MNIGVEVMRYGVFFSYIALISFVANFALYMTTIATWKRRRQFLKSIDAMVADVERVYANGGRMKVL